MSVEKKTASPQEQLASMQANFDELAKKWESVESDEEADAIEEELDQLQKDMAVIKETIGNTQEKESAAPKKAEAAKEMNEEELTERVQELKDATRVLYEEFKSSLEELLIRLDSLPEDIPEADQIKQQIESTQSRTSLFDTEKARIYLNDELIKDSLLKIQKKLESKVQFIEDFSKVPTDLKTEQLQKKLVVITRSSLENKPTLTASDWKREFFSGTEDWEYYAKRS